MGFPLACTECGFLCNNWNYLFVTSLSFYLANGINLTVLYFQEADNDNAEQMEEDIDGDLADIEALNYDDLDSVSKLQKTQRYIDIVQVI